MGKLIYGGYQRSFDVEDRLLAHLRLVFMNKLRRSEGFMYHHTDGNGTTSVWIHPAVSLVFHFYGSREPSINRGWIEELMQEASGARGLYVMPEPTSMTPVSGTPDPLPR